MLALFGLLGLVVSNSAAVVACGENKKKNNQIQV
ncbi:hypothetical protein [Mycoplasma capricolum]